MNLDFHIILKILDFLQAKDLVKMKFLSKKFYTATNMILRIRNNKLIKNTIFQKDQRLLTWLNYKNYRIHNVLNECICRNKLTLSYKHLKFFYIGEYHIERVNKGLDNIKTLLGTLVN